MEDGQIKVKIAVRIDYKPSRQIKIVGYIHCGLDYLGGGFYAKERAAFTIGLPRTAALRTPGMWRNGTGPIPSPMFPGTAGITEPQLSRVEGTFTVPDSGADGVRSFSGMDSQIKARRRALYQQADCADGSGGL